MDTIVQGITIEVQYQKVGLTTTKEEMKRTTETNRARAKAKHESAWGVGCLSAGGLGAIIRCLCLRANF